MTRWLTIIAARWLSRRYHDNQRRTVAEVARKMRVELNMPPHPALDRIVR
jgi:hypothetical protein